MSRLVVRSLIINLHYSVGIFNKKNPVLSLRIALERIFIALLNIRAFLSLETLMVKFKKFVKEGIKDSLV